MASFGSVVLQVMLIGMCMYIQVYTGPEVRILSQPSQMPSCMVLELDFLGLSLSHNLNFSSPSNGNRATEGLWKRRSMVTWIQGVLSR